MILDTLTAMDAYFDSPEKWTKGSEWRDKDGSPCSEGEAVCACFLGAMEEDWRTQSFGRRGDEIDEWCQRNDYTGPIIVIDDEGCDLNGHQFLIKTAMYAGFTKLDGERLVNLVGVLNENCNYKRSPPGVSSLPAS